MKTRKKNNENLIQLKDVSISECFSLLGGIYIVTNENIQSNQQMCVNLETGGIHWISRYGEVEVLPDAEIVY